MDEAALNRNMQGCLAKAVAGGGDVPPVAALGAGVAYDGDTVEVLDDAEPRFASRAAVVGVEELGPAMSRGTRTPS